MRDEAMPAVDVVFGLAGSSLPADHAEALARAVGEWLPWLADEPSAGIHPLRTSPTTQGLVLLARRARLVLRVPVHRAEAARALSGRRLDVGEGLATSEGEVRELMPTPTVYAGRVVSAAADDRAFYEEIERWLGAIGVDGEFIAGRAKPYAVGGVPARAWGLALHGLTPAASLEVQGAGYGPHRRLGCGIFVPHKAIAVAE